MKTRAILWCGQVRQPQRSRDGFNRVVEVGDVDLPLDDAKYQAQSLELAFQGALGLGVAPGDVHACVLHADLLPPSFRAQPCGATAVDLRRLISAIAKAAAPDDALLFIAVNHGARDGLLTSATLLDEFDEPELAPRLTPAALEDCLRPLQGPQIVIVAACYAGLFLRLGREGRVVLASCASDEPYHVRRNEQSWPAFLDQLFGAWCGVAFADTITRTRLDLDAAFTRAHEQLVDLGARNLPRREGTVVWPARK
jgi:hypothetical protein